jgi:hypothetical protein
MADHYTPRVKAVLADNRCTLKAVPRVLRFRCAAYGTASAITRIAVAAMEVWKKPSMYPVPSYRR